MGTSPPLPPSFLPSLLILDHITHMAPISDSPEPYIIGRLYITLPPSFLTSSAAPSLSLRQSLYSNLAYTEGVVDG